MRRRRPLTHHGRGGRLHLNEIQITAQQNLLLVSGKKDDKANVEAMKPKQIAIKTGAPLAAVEAGDKAKAA